MNDVATMSVKVCVMMLLRCQLKVVDYSLHINIIMNDVDTVSVEGCENDVATVSVEGCGLFTEHKYHYE